MVALGGPSPAAATHLGLEDVAERGVAATVQISTRDGQGAGVIIDPSGLVLTAGHVVTEGEGSF